MGKMTWDTFLERVKKDFPKAEPEKVFNMMKPIFGKVKQESDYQVMRNSWAYIVVGSLANKIGTTNKNKKIPMTQVIGNWVKTKDYQGAWRCFHPKKFKNKKLNKTEWNESSEEDFNKITTERHIKNLNDIWVSKNGKKIRSNLSPNNKFYMSSKFGEYAKKLESDE